MSQQVLAKLRQRLSHISKPILALALCAALIPLLSACKGDREINAVPVITTEPPVELPTMPDVSRIEWDCVVVGDTVYATWAQQQSAGSQLYDVYFAMGLIGEDLSALGENVSETAALDSRTPSIAVDSGGSVSVAWVEGASPTRSILVASRDAIAGVFGQPGAFADDVQDSVAPEAHYDSDDTLHVIWAEAGEILYRRRPDGGAASSTITMPRGTGADPANPTLTSDDEGNVFTMWEQTSPNSRRHIYIASSRNAGVTFLNGDHGWLPSSMLNPGLAQPKAVSVRETRCFMVVYLLSLDVDDVEDRRVRVSYMANYGAQLRYSRDVYMNQEGIPGTSADIATVIDGDQTSAYASWVSDGQVHLRGSLDAGASWGEDNELSLGFGGFNSARRVSIGAEGDRVVVLWDAESEDSPGVRNGWLTEADVSSE